MTSLFPSSSGFAHESPGGSNQNEWLTPPALIRALGVFDLDPCAPERRPWEIAREHFHASGLERAWRGRVWLNPPYGRYLGRWLSRGAEHRNCTALTFARTETRVFQRVVFPNATAVLFTAGRLRFWKPDGTEGDCATAPSVLIAFDRANADALERSGITGKFIRLGKGAQS